MGVRFKAVDALWKLSSLRAVIASDLGPSLTELSQDISTIRYGIAQAR
ncbi:hypothetical protein [Bradyrhizobium barranii]